MTEKNATWHQDSPFKATDYTQEQWLDGVDRVLNGADYNTALVTKTSDGIEIQPLYEQTTKAPFYSRGDKKWLIQQSFAGGSIADINQQILSDLAEGLSAVELSLSSQSNNPTIACHNVEQLEQLLKNVQPHMIQLSLTPGAENTVCGALLLAYYYRQKIAAQDIHAALNIDPLGSLAATGHSTENNLYDIAQFAAHCGKQFPNVSTLCADISVYHNAGCTEAQELAYLLATTVAYVRALTDDTQANVDINTAFKQIRFRIALDCDFFISIAKLRAARKLINQVAFHCGATDSAIVIDTVTSKRSMSELDAGTNILRTSTQAAAAMTGGANSYNCTPYDQLSENSIKAHRLARNTHHILIEESGLLEVDDPTRGSGYVESLTQSLSETAWELFQKIESEGGMNQALLNGTVAQQITSAASERTQSLATGQSAIVGVTDYPNLDDQLTEKAILPHTQTTEQKHTETSKVSVPALIGALSEGDSTTDYHTAYCDSTLKIAPIERFRDAEPFEQLRIRSFQYKKSRGSSPTVSLITLGTQKEFAPRASFCENFFATAGIDTQQIDIADYKATKDSIPLVVLCASDKRYTDEAIEACKKLQGKTIWIAGNHPKATANLDKHGITEKIHLSCDRLVVLDSALTVLGA